MKHLALLSIVCVGLTGCAQRPLPSWRDTPARQAIFSFVESVSDEGSHQHVPQAERIAVFDNDGTLWAEQPAYFQLLFAIDRVRAMAPQHPEWNNTEPFASAIRGDMHGLMAGGKEGLMKLLAASHADITADDFAESVHEWLTVARHPATGRPYTEMVYQPMLELLNYLRANGFKTYIVSGGGVDVMRVFAEEVYGVPPEQVIGSSLAAAFEMRDGVPTIVKQPEGLFVDDKEGKPISIYRHIGRRPVFAAGNSDGDLRMLEYTTIPRTDDDRAPRFGLIVRHTDASREWAYDRSSHIGALNQALDDAPRRGWTVVDMARDWNTVFIE